MLRDSVVVVRMRPRAIPLAMITIRKSTHGFPFVSHIWDAFGVPLGGPSGCRSSAINSNAIYCYSRALAAQRAAKWSIILLETRESLFSW